MLWLVLLKMRLARMAFAKRFAYSDLVSPVWKKNRYHIIPV